MILVHVYNYAAWFRFLSSILFPLDRQTKHIQHTKFKCRCDYDRERIREEQNNDVLIVHSLHGMNDTCPLYN